MIKLYCTKHTRNSAKGYHAFNGSDGLKGSSI